MVRSFILGIANLLLTDRVSTQLRVRLLRLAGVRLRNNVVVLGPVSILPSEAANLLDVGSHSFINTNVRFRGKGGVTIGKFVQIGSNVAFETTSHSLNFVEGSTRPSFVSPIRIEDHVWIGSGAIIVAGVTIGRGAVVAAGAVVSKNVEPMMLVGGVPARPIRKLCELPTGALVCRVD